MKVDIITVGDEIVSGRIVDINTQYLANEMQLLGYQVRTTKSIGDNSQDIIDALLESYEKSDLVFICGGLGPTVDDITRESVASSVNKQLQFNNQVYEQIKAMFENRGLTMAPSNKKQAYIIEDSTVLENSCGTAPGIYLDNSNVKIFVLPGPPKELQTMYNNQVKQYLQSHSKPNFSKTFKVVGIGESSLEAMVYDVISKYDVNYGIYANGNLVDIVVSSSQEDGKFVINRLSDEIITVLGDNCYSDSLSLVETVAELLIAKEQTIAFAESCTGGMIASTLVSYPSISQVFNRSYVTYSNESKHQVLGVSNEILNTHGAVSEAVVREMAYGLHQVSGSDICLSVSGIAGPDGGSVDKPVGTVWICIYYNGEYYPKKFFVYGERNRVRSNACNLCLFEILKLLKENNDGL